MMIAITIMIINDISDDNDNNYDTSGDDDYDFRFGDYNCDNCNDDDIRHNSNHDSNDDNEE